MENTTYNGNGNTEFNLSSKQLELLYQQVCNSLSNRGGWNKEDVLTATPAAMLSDLEGDYHVYSGE